MVAQALGNLASFAWTGAVQAIYLRGSGFTRRLVSRALEGLARRALAHDIGHGVMDHLQVFGLQGYRVRRLVWNTLGLDGFGVLDQTDQMQVGRAWGRERGGK